jgi:hypothetical protein
MLDTAIPQQQGQVLKDIIIISWNTTHYLGGHCYVLKQETLYFLSIPERNGKFFTYFDGFGKRPTAALCFILALFLLSLIIYALIIV